MNRIRSLIGAIVLSALAPIALAQAAGAGADYNKAERERVQRQAAEQRKRYQCQQDCETIFRGQYPACGGYAMTAQPTCMLNIDKNKAKCYQACR